MLDSRVWLPSENQGCANWPSVILKIFHIAFFEKLFFFHTSTIVRFVEVSKKCNVSQSSLYSLLTTPYNVSFTKLCQYNTEILIFLPCRLTYKKAFFTQAKEEKKQRIQPYLYRLVFNEYFWKFFSEVIQGYIIVVHIC